MTEPSMNTSDLVLARSLFMAALNEYPVPYFELVCLADAYADTAYEVGRAAERHPTNAHG